MLSKQTGASVVVTTTASSVIVNVSNTDGSAVRKVRVANDTAPALISITTSSNLSGAGILMPAGTVEHFSLEGSDHIHIVRSGSTNGIASITPIA
jgi:hypothetical protein